MMVFGGSVNGGVCSDWPTLTDADGEPDLCTTTDHRAVIGELLAVRGNPANLDAVFPGFNRPAPLGLVA